MPMGYLKVEFHVILRVKEWQLCDATLYGAHIHKARCHGRIFHFKTKTLEIGHRMEDHIRVHD